MKVHYCLNGVESGVSSSGDTLKPTPGEADRRFQHYELVTGEDGKPVELGRGAMGVTYKAFDINLRCLVTLKVITAISAMNRRDFAFCAKPERRPAFVTQVLPRFSTWAESVRTTFTRWSLYPKALDEFGVLATKQSEAFTNKDAAAVAALFTEDAVLVAPDGIFSGRQ